MSFTMPYSKLFNLAELSANDVKFISVDRQNQDIHKYIYLWSVNFIFVDIQPDSTNMKNDPRMTFALAHNYVRILQHWTIELHRF